jgi:O-antigen/teichoic acid export membrane protein
MWSKILKANVAYALGNAANSAALFLLVPFLVNTLSPIEYGAWSLFELGILLLNMAILAGMDVGLMREYWFLEGEPERRRLIGTVLIAASVWGVGLSGTLGATLWLLQGQFDIFSTSQLTPDWVVIILAIGILEAIFALLLTLFRIREQASLFVALSLGRMVLFLTMAITGVWLGGGLSAALFSRLLASLAGVIGGGLLIREYLAVEYDWQQFRRVLRYGLPLLPASLASYILFASDRYMLQHFSTLEKVAIYSFAYKIATILDVIVTRPFAMDWAPRRFKIATAADAPRKYAQVLVLYAFVAIGFALVVIALTPPLYAWLVPPLYQAGIGAVPVILAAYVIYGLSYPLNIGIMLKDRTNYLPVVSWIAAGVCLLLNTWLIPRFGMLGAAWATVVAYIFWTVSIAWISLRLYPVPYSPRQIGWVVLMGVVGYGGIWGVEQTGVDFNWALVLAFKGIWIVLVLGLTGYAIWHTQRIDRGPDQNVPFKPEVSSSR